MEAGLLVAAKIILTISVAGFLVLFFYLYELLVLRPKGVRSKLQSQGIGGPPPTFVLGNLPEMMKLQSKKSQKSTATEYDFAASEISHQWHLKLHPHIEVWREKYGPIFLHSSAHIQQLDIIDIEIVKEFVMCTSINLGMPSMMTKALGSLLGEGILSSNGSLWRHHRKIIAPELYLDNIKGMLNLIVDSATSFLTTWEAEIQSHGGIAEVKVDDHLRNLSADIISKACFHSDYCQGEEIFSKIRNLQILLADGLMGIEGLTRWFPTRQNRQIWKLEKEIESLIMKVVKERGKSSNEQDLLQMLLEGAKSCGGLISPKKFIVDNCKTIFFAGHETTSVVASWSLMLLALHPDWQACARAELLEVCGDKPLEADMIRNMKVLTMVIHEVLRLYPPVFFISREVYETITLKNITLPKGMLLQIPIPFLHQNPDLWGADAHKFNPERFANGVSKACKAPQAYMPFGVGPRICVGQHLAMTELKVILSLILSKFCFSLSPAYQHSPSYSIFTEPEHGVILTMRRA